MLKLFLPSPATRAKFEAGLTPLECYLSKNPSKDCYIWWKFATFGALIILLTFLTLYYLNCFYVLGYFIMYNATPLCIMFFGYVLCSKWKLKNTP